MRPIDRAHLPAGLRWRLAGWFTLLTLLCIAIVFVAVYRGTGAQLRGEIDHATRGRLGRAGARPHDGTRGKSQAGFGGGRPLHGRAALQCAARRCCSFSPRARRRINSPELFGNPSPDDGETAAEQDRENRLSAALLSVTAGYHTLELPDVGAMRVLRRSLRLSPRTVVSVGAGESLAPVSRAQHGVARTFLLAGLLALAAALLLSYFVGSRLSRPLRRMAAVAARVDAGDLHPRIAHRGAAADEVKILADAFDHMLDRLTDAFAGQRAFVADASHELRTPLTVIRGQLEVLASQREPSGEEVAARRAPRAGGDLEDQPARG